MNLKVKLIPKFESKTKYYGNKNTKQNDSYFRKQF